MATTTNYGWTTPDDTALVKDGASAIRTLGSSIDTSLNTALGTKKAGLVLLNTTSFSGVTSVSLPASTFTSTYENYRIIANVTPVTNTAVLQARMRAAGSDNSNANYFNLTQGLDSNGATANILSKLQTSWSLYWMNSGGSHPFTLDLMAPQKTAYTNFVGLSTSVNSAGNEYTGYRLGGVFTATTSFDSITFISSTGNIAGKLQVFGYNE
jgi:hypothetical protein